MKKLMSAAALSALVLTLTACGGAAETTGTHQAEYSANSGWALTTEVTMKGDDVVSVTFDAVADPENEKTAAYAAAGDTKKSLKEEYGMAKAATAGEWYLQAAAIEAFVVENDGVDTIELNDAGQIDNVAGATVKGADFIAGFEAAVAAAK